MQSQNPSNLCADCKRVLDEEKSEIELINELQDAITESLRKTNESQHDDKDETMSCMSVDSQQLNGEIHENNLAIWSPQNDIGDITDALDSNGKRPLSPSNELTLLEPAPKRRRVCGPKSKTRLFERVRRKQIVSFEPLPLLSCVLNHVNRMNVPDFYSENFTKVVTELDELEVLCYYCEKTFSDMASLAVHEGRHVRVELQERVDLPGPWDAYRPDSYVRNKWWKEVERAQNQSQPEEECEELLVPITSAPPESEEPPPLKVEAAVEEKEEEEPEGEEEGPPIAGEIVLIDTKPTVGINK